MQTFSFWLIHPATCRSLDGECIQETPSVISCIYEYNIQRSTISERGKKYNRNSWHNFPRTWSNSQLVTLTPAHCRSIQNSFPNYSESGLTAKFLGRLYEEPDFNWGDDQKKIENVWSLPHPDGIGQESG